MKKLVQSSIFLLSLGLFAQVTVSTLTPQFKGSGGLSLDVDGNLLIGDFGDFLSILDPDGLPNHVMKLDTDLNLTLFSTGFVGASGNDFDSNGILYQNDIGASEVYKIVGGVRTFVTSTGIANPVGIAFDGNDDFFVCNCGNNTIRKVTSAGVSTLFASGSIFSCPNGITVDENDNLYVSNFSNGNIIKISPAGVTTLLATTPGGSTSGPSNGHLDYFEPTRTLFIASHGSNRIFALRLDNPTQLIDIAGSGVRGNNDGDGSTASFSRPNGVAVTQSGDSIFINSAIPLTNIPNGPLNPQVIRLITGVNSILSIHENALPDLVVKAYPNPVEDRITIESDLSNDYSDLNLSVRDLQGKLVTETPVILEEGNYLKISVDLSDLTSGMYLYALKGEGKQLFNGKILKR
jgi:Secretion system C-terminal sorting domain